MFKGWRFDALRQALVSEIESGPNAFDLNATQRALLRAVVDEWKLRLLLPGTAVDVNALQRGLHYLYEVGGLPSPRRWRVAAGPREARAMAEAHGGEPCNAEVYAGLEIELRRGSLHWEQFHMSGSGLEPWRRLVRQMVEVARAAAPGMLGGLGTVSVHWTAYYEFLHRARLLRSGGMPTWVDFIKGGAWDCCLFPDEAIIVRPPEHVTLDERERLHGTRPPAVRWGDGTAGYFAHGIAIEPWIIEAPERLTAELVLGQRNTEVRRVMIELMGAERFVREARPRVLDQDSDGAGMPRRLLAVELPGDERYSMVEVKCPSTGHVHYLRVPPRLGTCSAAVAWTFGFEPATYAPLIQA